MPRLPKIRTWHIPGKVSTGNKWFNYSGKSEIGNYSRSPNFYAKVGVRDRKDPRWHRKNGMALVTRARLPKSKQKHINSVKQIRYLDKTSRRSHIPFQLASAHGSVKSAETLAEWFRAKGFNARIVKWTPKGNQWEWGNQVHDTSVGEMRAGVFVRPKYYGYSWYPKEREAISHISDLNNGAIRELRSKQIQRNTSKPFTGGDWEIMREIPMLPGDEKEDERVDRAIPIYNKSLEDRQDELQGFGEEVFDYEIGTNPEFGLDRPLNSNEREELNRLLEAQGVSSRFQRKLLIIKMPDNETVSYGFLTAPEAVDVLYGLGVFPETGDIAEWLQGDSAFNENMRLTAANRKRLTQLLVRNSITDGSVAVSERVPKTVMGDETILKGRENSDPFVMVGAGEEVDFAVMPGTEIWKVFEDLPDLATAIDTDDLYLARMNPGEMRVSQFDDVWKRQEYIDPEIVIRQLSMDYPEMNRRELSRLYDELTVEDVDLMFNNNAMDWDDSARVVMGEVGGFRDGEGLGVGNDWFEVDDPAFKLKIPNRILGFYNSSRNYGTVIKDRMTFDEKFAFSKLIWGV